MAGSSEWSPTWNKIRYHKTINAFDSRVQNSELFGTISAKTFKAFVVGLHGESATGQKLASGWSLLSVSLAKIKTQKS